MFDWIVIKVNFFVALVDFWCDCNHDGLGRWTSQWLLEAAKNWASEFWTSSDSKSSSKTLSSRCTWEQKPAIVFFLVIGISLVVHQLHQRNASTALQQQHLHVGGEPLYLRMRVCRRGFSVVRRKPSTRTKASTSNTWTSLITSLSWSSSPRKTVSWSSSTLRLFKWPLGGIFTMLDEELVVPKGSNKMP